MIVDWRIILSCLLEISPRWLNIKSISKEKYKANTDRMRMQALGCKTTQVPFRALLAMHYGN